MTSMEVLGAVRYLIGFALFLSGAEFYLLSRKTSFRRIWSDRNLESDFRDGIPLPGAVTRRLFSLSFFPILAWLEMTAAVGMVVFPGIGWIPLLILIHLAICIRFRGTFNGGSDMMIFVVLSGLLIAEWTGGEWGRKLGLSYIALHTGYSYLKAGAVKLWQEDWRKGAALPVFLSRSPVVGVDRVGAFLENHPKISKGIGGAAMLFEVSILALLVFPWAGFIYVALAVSFHFGNFLAFGLNRFFWVWCAAWPALLYSLSLLK